MSFFDKLKKAKGGYIFLSHSHDDIEKVREIRNSLEKDGFEPLCFYLKCLDDDSEIEDLIKREIDAREWFVFVNSENSRKSKWVTLEREYITRTDAKKIITVDIDNEQSIADTIHKISHNLRVFISSSSKDETLARRIKNRFQAKDYLVFFAPDSIPARTDYTTVIANAITEASKDGCVIALLTPNSLESKWVQREIMFASHEGGNIIPVIVGNTKLDGVLRFELMRRQMYNLSENPTDDEIDEMIDQVGRAILM
jgi:hypothetical protein